MKQCPFCKAEIQENARFCLYCMKPLNEKEVIPPLRRKMVWWPLIAGAVAVLLLVVLLLLPGNKPESDTPTDEMNLAADQTETGDASPAGSEAATGNQGSSQPSGNPGGNQVSGNPGNQQPSGDPGGNQPSGNPGDNQSSGNQGGTTQNTTGTQTGQQSPETTVPEATGDTQPAVTKDTQPARNTTPTETTTPVTTPATQGTTAPTEQETTAPTTPPAASAFTYRAARAGDDFYANYQNSGSDIVITGIQQISASGVYDIPSYIDGKRVIAIVANAFSGSNARVVYVPATVKTIWNYAFAGCGLTDIYFRGNAIYAQNMAFPSGVTIHCSAACSDRNYRYYKNSAGNYGAVWQEWNG